MSSGTYRRPPPRALRWVEEVVGSGSRVLEVSRLQGGLTADMDRLSMSSRTAEGDHRFDVVLRRWSGNRWGPGLIEREARGLEALADHHLPVPRLLAADRSGERSGVPCLLMAALPGQPVFRVVNVEDGVDQLADVLALIHAVDPAGLEPTDPHGFDERRIEGWLRDPALVTAVKQAARRWREPRTAVLVHGDYQLSNILWQKGKLSGVVDWSYVGSGAREIDVGLCRLALAVLHSAEAAERFLRRYEAFAGVGIDPRNDIRHLMAFSSDWLDHLAEHEPSLDRERALGQVERLVRMIVGRLG